MVKDFSLKESFKWGYITGLFISLFTIYWIVFPTSLGVVAVILVHALYYGLFAVLFTRMAANSLTLGLASVPFLWTAIEYGKSVGELGFPWVSLGYSQSYYLPFIQYVEYTSIYGVSFWICVLNVVIFWIYLNREDLRIASISGIVLVILFLLPLSFAPQKVKANSQKVKVALVQGNIDPYQKWEKENRDRSFFLFDSLSQSIGKGQVDLIIWPETATPVYLLRSRQKLSWITGLYEQLNTPIFTGTPDYEWIDKKKYKTFNSLTLIDGSTGPFELYSKIKLVPFGERIPYQDILFFIKWILSKFNLGEGNFSPGESIKLFQLRMRQNPESKISFGGVICFESTFPEFVGEVVKKGAAFIVIVTNDGWYKRTGAPYQHAQMAVFRAIENRTPIARCANTGISMTIDPYGKIRKETGIFEEAVITDTLQTRTQLTYFTKNGHVFSHIISAIAIVLLIFTSIFENYFLNDKKASISKKS
ncbi:MAG: apolipoprotein N-acyltransferase [Deferribacteres bacterium]|nr:apolipoprotein N-acyltransferase [candidate division KSB1 bacterium]MCB9501481.1 apolipoprotein N-acyltransferase [Deferribacteres bacterium]